MGKELEQMLQRRDAILAGDSAKIQAQHDSGKLTARERIAKFVGDDFTEIDQLVENGASGVVTGYGVAEGTPVYIWAQDATAKGGAISAAGAQKVIKLLDMAKKAGRPVVALLDSMGVRIDEGVCALGGFAGIISKIAELSGVVPQIALVLGPAVGGAATTALLSDIVIQSKNGFILSAGPQVLASARGAAVDPAAFGGPDAAAKAGLNHLTADTEEDAFKAAARVIGMLPLNSATDDDMIESADTYGRLIPELDRMDVCDMRAAINLIADDGDVVELQSEWAKNAVTALAPLGERTVGFVGAQGRICPCMAEKIARFVRMCDCFNLPVITLCDVEGFSFEADNARMVRAQSTLAYAYAEATVPKLAVITGKGIGAAYMAIASKAVTDVAFAWPQASVAALDAPAAVQIMHHEDLVGAADPAAKRAELEGEYLHDVADGINAARFGQIDAAIVPSETRKALTGALETLEGKREVRAPRKHGNMPV